MSVAVSTVRSSQVVSKMGVVIEGLVIRCKQAVSAVHPPVARVMATPELKPKKKTIKTH